MGKSLICVFAIMAAMAIVTGCGLGSARDAVAINADNELYVEAGDFDVYFELLEPFTETFMLFGGDRVTHEAAFNDFWLAAISMEDARPIYKKHPDFYMCASPGAARAKNAVQTMNIVVESAEMVEAQTALEGS